MAWYCNFGDLVAAGLDPRLTANDVIDVAMAVPPHLLQRAIWRDPSSSRYVLYDASVARSGRPQLVKNGRQNPRLRYKQYEVTTFTAQHFSEHNLPHFKCEHCHHHINNCYTICPLCGTHYTCDTIHLTQTPLHGSEGHLHVLVLRLAVVPPARDRRGAVHKQAFWLAVLPYQVDGARRKRLTVEGRVQHRKHAERARRKDLLQHQHGSHARATRREAHAAGDGGVALVGHAEAVALEG